MVEQSSEIINKEPSSVPNRFPGQICIVCEKQIDLLAPMFATTTSGEKKRLVWGHFDCWVDSKVLITPPDCRHWLRTGKCVSLEAGLCAFDHTESKMN